MLINEYQQLAQRTANKELDKRERLVIAALGLAGEAGEVADHIKKVVGHGHTLDLTHLEKELGDVMWNIAEIVSVIESNMEAVANKNIEKLWKRYPEGFSHEASLNRPVGD